VRKITLVIAVLAIALCSPAANRSYAYVAEGGHSLVYAPSMLWPNPNPPTAAEYAAAGWLPVIDNPPPSDPPSGYHYEFRSYEVFDGAIRRVYALIADPPPPPRVFVTADLVEQLMSAGVWPQVRAWIDSQGLLDLVLATKEFDETNANFISGREALASALGWTDEEVEELLSKCVKEDT